MQGARHSAPTCTYVAWIKHCRVFAPNLRKGIPLVKKKTVHVSNKPKILLVPRRLTYRLPPFLDQLQDAVLRSRRPQRRPLGEPPHQIIEKLLCADLQLEWIPAVLDADVEKLPQSARQHKTTQDENNAYRQCQQRDVLVSGVDQMNYLKGSLPRTGYQSHPGQTPRNRRISPILLSQDAQKLTHCPFSCLSGRQPRDSRQGWARSSAGRMRSLSVETDISAFLPTRNHKPGLTDCSLQRRQSYSLSIGTKPVPSRHPR